MNAEYIKIIAASDSDRRDLFVSAASHIGTTVQNIEKDFWVCWTLDALFHQLKPGGPRLLFKGGTSLSKGFGLISRFSEDIDVTVFRSDLNEDASFEELEQLSNKKRRAKLDDIKAACQTYIKDTLRGELQALAAATMAAANQDMDAMRITLDEADVDQQSLLIHYPSAVEQSDYVTPSVKIESGAKSALDPNAPQLIKPYVSDILKNSMINVDKVTTIDPQRTFLDKILILHGMTHYFEARGTMRGGGRMSRHYYDVYRLMSTSVGKTACTDTALIDDCVRHARMFFYRADTGLESAQRGAFRLQPPPGMLDALRADYNAMRVMIFGNVPSFDDVLAGVTAAEQALNTP